MKRAITIAIPSFFAALLAFSQPLLADRRTPCKFEEKKPDRRGWARFQCPDCSVVTVKQGPWSQKFVARSVCCQVGPGDKVKIVLPNNRKPARAKPLDHSQEIQAGNKLEIMVIRDLIMTDCGNIRSCYEPLIQSSRYLRDFVSETVSTLWD